MPTTTHDLGLKTCIETVDAFVRCTLMGNQPWPQFQNGIRERSIHAFSERIVMIYRKLMILLDTRCSVSSHHGIPLSAIQEKTIIARSIKT